MNNLALFSKKPLTGAVFSACMACGAFAYSAVAVAEGTSSYHESQTSTQAAPGTETQGAASVTSSDQQQQQRSASSQQEQRSATNQQEQRSAASGQQDSALGQQDQQRSAASQQDQQDSALGQQNQQRSAASQQGSTSSQQEQRSAASGQQDQQEGTAMGQRGGSASESAPGTEEAPAAIVSIVAITEVPVVDLEQLVDTDVINQEGETIGDVEQVVTNPDGTIAGLIVGAGGVLGMGETDLFAPATELQLTPEGVMWQTLLDEDALAEMPQYQAEEYSVVEP